MLQLTISLTLMIRARLEFGLFNPARLVLDRAGKVAFNMRMRRAEHAKQRVEQKEPWSYSFSV